MHGFKWYSFTDVRMCIKHAQDPRISHVLFLSHQILLPRQVHYPDCLLETVLFLFHPSFEQVIEHVFLLPLDLVRNA